MPADRAGRPVGQGARPAVLGEFVEHGVGGDGVDLGDRGVDRSGDGPEPVGAVGGRGVGEPGQRDDARGDRGRAESRPDAFAAQRVDARPDAGEDEHQRGDRDEEDREDGGHRAAGFVVQEFQWVVGGGGLLDRDRHLQSGFADGEDQVPGLGPHVVPQAAVAGAVDVQRDRPPGQAAQPGDLVEGVVTRRECR